MVFGPDMKDIFCECFEADNLQRGFSSIDKRWDSYFVVWSSNPIVCCLMELVLCASRTCLCSQLETGMKECQVCQICFAYGDESLSVG